MPRNPFHEHLDVCTQCRTRPMELCALGAQLLKTTAVRDVLPISCPGCSAPIRKFALGNESLCTDCNGQLCERCCEERKKKQ